MLISTGWHKDIHNFRTSELYIPEFMMIISYKLKELLIANHFVKDHENVAYTQTVVTNDMDSAS